MDFNDINDFYDEICFKLLNNMKITNCEKDFFYSYTSLFVYSQILASEKAENLKKLYKEFGIDF